MAAKKGAKKAAKKSTAKRAAAKPAKKAAAKPAKRAAARKSAPKVKHPICHWEIQAKNPEAMQRFYGELFGWTIDANNPMKYGMVSSGGGPGEINGGIGGSMSGMPRVVVYAAVPDINATITRAESLGAKTLMPRTDIGPVIMALFEDLEGNTFGLVEG
jgi:predicted enzyme related to lactoylglutathione lyase